VKGYAPIVRAAITSLQDGTIGLPVRVPAFNAEVANLVDLVQPAAYVFGGEDAYTGAYPYVEVAVTDGRKANLAIGQVDMDVAATATVVVWVDVFELGGSTVEGEISRLYEGALGYGRVVQEVLLQPDAWGPSVIVSEIRDSYQANPETRDFQRFRMGAFSFFDLLDEDSRPIY
jgi:hypothetical protein